MTNNIVTVNVSQTVAPAPSTLQSTGAIISQGATTKAPGSKTLITGLADLTTILQPTKAITSLAWSGNVVTATATAPHGFTVADVLDITIAGATPAGYNGTHPCTIVDTTTFTYPLVGNPGAETVPGTYVLADVAEVRAMGTTFFAQGSSQAVYLLELGPAEPADGIADLDTYIAASPQFFYSYLVPRSWADEDDYITFLGQFLTPTSKTYFFTTLTTGNYGDFSGVAKCVFGVVEAPGIPATEFTAAAPFWVTLHYAPSTTNKVTPTAFSYVFDVTAYPTAGNSALLATLKAAGVNVIGTGAEGGISNLILLWGTTLDKNDFTYWYSVDWVQINVDLDVANAIINGSNNPINPLYYNQDGINRLQAVAAGTMSRGVTYGLVLGTVQQTALDGPALTDAINASAFSGGITDVNAVPFVPYSKTNPSDYAIGRYAGFTIVYTPARGFTAIVFNINVTQFVAQ